jgi:hypothetical protein
MHWFSFHIIILVNIMYRSNKDFDPVELGSKILKEIHYYMYDEKEHDTFLSNMLSNYSSYLWNRRVVFINIMWCGLMGVLVSSKVHDIGFLYQGVIMKQFVVNSQVDVKWRGITFLLAMVRGR